jgi:hypothetical protein
MKKQQLIECGIIVVGLVLMYHLFVQLFELLALILHSNNWKLGDTGKSMLVRQGLWLCGFIVLVYALLRFSRSIAKIFTTPPDNSTTPFMIKISGRAILRVALIVVALVQIFASVPILYNRILETWNATQIRLLDAEREMYLDAQQQALQGSLITLVFALLIIFSSGILSRAFFPRPDRDE